jgi:hypothetical protein
MSGDLLVFGDDTYVEKNQIYSVLFEQSLYDDIVQTYLEILLPISVSLLLNFFRTVFTSLLAFAISLPLSSSLLLFNQITVLLLAKQLGFGVPLSLESNSHTGHE